MCGGGCRGGGGCSSTDGVAVDGRGIGAAGCEGTSETSMAAIEGVVPAPTAGGDYEQADSALYDRRGRRRGVHPAELPSGESMR